MPCYDGECPQCGVIEIFKSMKDAFPARCPDCGKRGFSQILNTRIAFKPPVDAGWEGENQGRGRYISQLQKEPGPEFSDKGAFARSQHEAMEKAKRRGFSVTRAR